MLVFNIYFDNVYKGEGYWSAEVCNFVHQHLLIKKVLTILYSIYLYGLSTLGLLSLVRYMDSTMMV
jgi:hypothetical protein